MEHVGKDNGELLAKFSLTDIVEEQEEIQQTYLSMRFSQKIREISLGCYKHCGGKPRFPFKVEPKALIGSQEVCFSDCVNAKFEDGPFLHELGPIPEGDIPKKFVWSHGL